MVGRMRDSLVPHIGQVVAHQVELPQNLYIVLFVVCLAMGDPIDVYDALVVKEWDYYELPCGLALPDFLGS